MYTFWGVWWEDWGSIYKKSLRAGVVVDGGVFVQAVTAEDPIDFGDLGPVIAQPGEIYMEVSDGKSLLRVLIKPETAKRIASAIMEEAVKAENIAGGKP